MRGTIGARATRSAEGRAAAQPADGELTASPLLVVSSYFLNSISRLIGVPSPVSMRRVFGGQNVVARDSGSQASPSKLRFGDLDATPSFIGRHAHGLGACHWCQHWHATPSTWHSPTQRGARTWRVAVAFYVRRTWTLPTAPWASSFALRRPRCGSRWRKVIGFRPASCRSAPTSLTAASRNKHSSARFTVWHAFAPTARCSTRL